MTPEIKSLSTELTAIEAQLAQLQWMPSTHLSVAQLPALEQERDAMKAQLDAAVEAHEADVKRRSAGHDAYVSKKRALEFQLATIAHKMVEAGWLPAPHPAHAAIPGLEVEKATLEAKLAALVDPGYDRS